MSTTAKAPPDEIDLDEVDGIVRATGTEAEHLVPILQAIQGRFRYLPPEAMARLGELTGMSLAHIAGVRLNDAIRKGGGGYDAAPPGLTGVVVAAPERVPVPHAIGEVPD